MAGASHSRIRRVAPGSLVGWVKSSRPTALETLTERDGTSRRLDPPDGSFVEIVLRPRFRK